MHVGIASGIRQPQDSGSNEEPGAPSSFFRFVVGQTLPCAIESGVWQIGERGIGPPTRFRNARIESQNPHPLMRQNPRAVRESGFVIERRPKEADPFTGDRNAHVVIGTAQSLRRIEYERCAKKIEFMRRQESCPGKLLMRWRVSVLQV